jgi:hypothetical protein
MPLFEVQMAILNAELGYASAVTAYRKALAEIEFLTGHAPERTGAPEHGSTR